MLRRVSKSVKSEDAIYGWFLTNFSFVGEQITFSSVQLKLPSRLHSNLVKNLTSCFRFVGCQFRCKRYRWENKHFFTELSICFEKWYIKNVYPRHGCANLWAKNENPSLSRLLRSLRSGRKLRCCCNFPFSSLGKQITIFISVFHCNVSYSCWLRIYIMYALYGTRSSSIYLFKSRDYFPYYDSSKINTVKSVYPYQ